MIAAIEPTQVVTVAPWYVDFFIKQGVLGVFAAIVIGFAWKWVLPRYDEARTRQIKREDELRARQEQRDEEGRRQLLDQIKERGDQVLRSEGRTKELADNFVIAQNQLLDSQKQLLSANDKQLGQLDRQLYQLDRQLNELERLRVAVERISIKLETNEKSKK